MARFMAAAMLCSMLPFAYGQGVTGQMSGTVVDASSGVLAGATVRLTAVDTKQERSFKTGGNGAFSFTGLIPGT